MWGGGAEGGGAIQVNLVGSLPAIPLPRPDVVTTSRVVDVTKGLYKSEPPPPVPPPKATPLPEFFKEKRPRWVSPRKSKLLENKAPPPPNAIPYGQGGSPAVPYSNSNNTFTMGQNAQAGMNLGGPAGGFGKLFPWYVEAVQRRVSSNWLESTIDPTLSWAPRAVVDFQILRDGTIANVQLTKSSGNASVDASVVRAVEASGPLNPLPGGYTGSYVNVEFWFDFKR